MASGEPVQCLMKQIQLAVCQLCGKGMGNSSQEGKVNYQKQVDEPNKPYTQLIPDYRYDEIESRNKKGASAGQNDKNPLQICIQFPKCVQQTGDKKGSKEPNPTANNDPENSATVKSACCPTGGQPCPPPVKMMLCLPCPPAEMAAGQASSATPCSSNQKKKPKDYTYRCESRELRGGNLYQCCQCLKRNGLQHDCPRTPCQGRPACLVKPWPDCWPSGGCHGIDFSRENGVKRYDPCAEQRFDKKDCRPGGGQSTAKSDCAGNMMIVVCPTGQPPC